MGGIGFCQCLFLVFSLPLKEATTVGIHMSIESRVGRTGQGKTRQGMWFLVEEELGQCMGEREELIVVEILPSHG